MAVRNDFSSGEVLTAADLNDTFAAKLDLAGGKILQIVEDLDALERSTTSTSFTNVPGMQVTITPQFSDSTIYVIASVYLGITQVDTEEGRARLRIASGGNVLVSGDTRVGWTASPGGGAIEDRLVLIGRSTPATTSPVSYDLQFSVANTNIEVRCRNNVSQGMLLALEVSA